jgi:hypothetical protein
VGLLDSRNAPRRSSSGGSPATAGREGDISAARGLVQSALRQLPGHQNFLDFATEIGASLPSRARRLDLLVSRVLHDGDGPAPLAHPPRVDRMRRRALLELFEGGYEPWEVAAFFGPQPPPVLHNSEGHPLVQSTATYDVPEAEVEASWSRLAAELEEGDGPDHLLATGKLDDGGHVIRGSVHRVAAARGRAGAVCVQLPRSTADAGISRRCIHVTTHPPPAPPSHDRWPILGPRQGTSPLTSRTDGAAYRQMST